LKPWVEKYRPRKMDDVVYQFEVVEALKRSLETGNLPHLLFYGPPGTGKTSTILAIAYQLFGPDLMSERVLELNASDERGIDVVRDKVKNFAQLAVGKGVKGEYPCPPFKIVILDEADLMTGDAQNALRRTMEKFSHNTRFCIICNYISRIIEPLTSRCAKFRFKPLIIECIRTKLLDIIQLENIIISDVVLNRLIEVANGDLRKAITYLQSLYGLYGNDPPLETVDEISGTIPDEKIDTILSNCQQQQTSLTIIKNYVKSIIRDGYSTTQVLDQLYDKIIKSESILDIQKAKIIEIIAESDSSLTQGGDEFLQLLNVFAQILNILSI